MAASFRSSFSTEPVSAGYVRDGRFGKNAVENNLLANQYGVKKLDKAGLELYEKLKDADIGSIDDLQKRYKGCAGDGACERDIRNEYRNQENEAGKKLLGLYQSGRLTRDEYNVLVVDYAIAMLEGVKEGQRNGEGAGFLDIYSVSGADWAPAGVIGNPYVDAIRTSEKVAEWKRQGLSNEKIVTLAQQDGLIGSNLAPVDVPGVINLVDNGASREEVLKFAAAYALGKAVGGAKGTGTGKAPYTSTVSPDAHPVKEAGPKATDGPNEVADTATTEGTKVGLETNLTPEIKQHSDGSYRTPDGKFASPTGVSPPGTAKADEFAKHLESNGMEVVGTEMVVKGPLGDRRYDIVVRDANGKLHGLEVKSGSASKTSYQEFTDYFVNEFGAQGKGRLNGQVIESATKVYVP